MQVIGSTAVRKATSGNPIRAGAILGGCASHVLAFRSQLVWAIWPVQASIQHLRRNLGVFYLSPEVRFSSLPPLQLFKARCFNIILLKDFLSMSTVPLIHQFLWVTF